MKEYVISLLKSTRIAQDTMAFYFQKPNDFFFEAGQYVDMTIPHYLDPKNPDHIRSFTIASGPHEAYLMFATRMRDSAFKTSLKKMKRGESTTIQGPLGDFTLSKKVTKPLVFLAGGMGITPFLSMLCELKKKRSSQSVFLFYSNRKKDETPFLSELQNFVLHLSLTLITTFTREEGTHIDAKLLLNTLPNVNHAEYYIAGPPAMVGGMQRVILNLNVDMRNVHLDEFTGY